MKKSTEFEKQYWEQHCTYAGITQGKPNKIVTWEEHEKEDEEEEEENKESEAPKEQQSRA